MIATLTMKQAAELITIIADEIKKADAEPSDYKRIDVSLFDDEPVINVASFMQIHGQNVTVQGTELIDE